MVTERFGSQTRGARFWNKIRIPRFSMIANQPQHDQGALVASLCDDHRRFAELRDAVAAARGDDAIHAALTAFADLLERSARPARGARALHLLPGGHRTKRYSIR